MEENQNKNNDPITPPSGQFFSTWSVILGGLGLIGDCFCFPLLNIWELPAGLFFGLIGIACAILSRRQKPFSPQAQLGLILSIISLICGIIMAFSLIFIYDIMDTDTILGEYFRQALENPIQSLMPASPNGQ